MHACYSAGLFLWPARASLLDPLWVDVTGAVRDRWVLFHQDILMMWHVTIGLCHIREQYIGVRDRGGAEWSC